MSLTTWRPELWVERVRDRDRERVQPNGGISRSLLHRELDSTPPPVKEKKKVSLFATVMEHLKLIGDYGGN